MEELRITMIQTKIFWEDKVKNIEEIKRQICSLSGDTDLVVLPEMCTTGFSMNSSELAEDNNGYTITSFKELAVNTGIAITGSFIARDQEYNYFNRAFFLTPQGESHYYDKRHLFRMGDEISHFKPGNERVIFEYQNWKICLLVCYDLRFPVWSRNVNNEYDLLIYVSNWPDSRSHVWKCLLMARAIENMAYVCGVNRVGRDELNLNYAGESMLINAKGQHEIICGSTPCQMTAAINLKELKSFRKKFPAWMDADQFTIEW